MKVLVHKQQTTVICIQKLDSKNITGSFFKEKPEVGDIIMSHASREQNFLRMFEVQEIITNRDANISSECTYDPKKAYFVLAVNEVANDPRFAEFDNSIQTNLRA